MEVELPGTANKNAGYPVNVEFQINNAYISYSRDGGMGRNASLPCTAKRRITTNLKTINNQNFQSIKLWNSDNQGHQSKETFIYINRNGGDGQLGTEDPQQGGRLHRQGKAG